jgi:hypothetical protein
MSSELLLTFSPEATAGCCGVCQQPTASAAGLRLVTAGGLAPVCTTCGACARPLTALVQLASEACRVGRIGRHTVFPPYTALLDLARAADEFSTALPSN